MLSRSRLASPSRWLIASALCGLLIAATSHGSPQDTKKDKEDPAPRADFKATTMDGVRLVGDFYPPQTPKDDDKKKKFNKRDAPCVILLHGLFGKRQDFGELPRILQSEGYAVLAFDFRGHGDSKSVDPIYWEMNPPKRNLVKLPTTITANKDPEFRNQIEFVKWGHDLMEAKRWLNQKSEAGECNSNNIVLIGAEHGAVVAMLWTAHGLVVPQDRVGTGFGERGKLVRGPRLRIDKKPEGEDVSCIVCLSMRPFLGSNQNIENVLKPVMETLRDKLIGVLVLYGKQDRGSDVFWSKAYNRWLKPEDKVEQLERTALKAIEKTQLTGTKLLGQGDALGTEKYITTYLAKPKVLKDQLNQKKSDEEFQQSLFYWEKMGL